jgi:hypothetical protein
MRGIGGEAALHDKPLLQPLKRLIDRDDERARLGRHSLLRQAQRDRLRPDRACLGRGRPQRQKAPTDAVRGEQQRNRDKRRHVPRDIEYKFPQDGVNQLIAAGRFGDRYR